MNKFTEHVFMSTLAGFAVSLFTSWLFLLAYNIVSSVMPLPDANWYQATFFTWVTLTGFFVVAT